MKKSSTQLILIAGFIFVLTFCFGCKKSQPNIINDDNTDEWIETKRPKYKIILETDYPYYYIITKSPQDTAPVKENLRMQKYWEREVTAHSGDSISVEVNTINSNIHGTFIKIKILCNNQLVSSKEYVKTQEENCVNNCPLNNDAVSLISSVTVK